MPIEKLNLRKLLQLFYADDRKRRSMLRADIREERAKKAGTNEAGGDFYGPFWADVRGHVADKLNLGEQTKHRIASNKGRARLYPILTDCFLSMWQEKIRWRNEPFQFASESVKTQLNIEELGAVVKIENTVSVVTWDGSRRVVYPYFFEDPSLPAEGARLGFWLLSRALPEYHLREFRIIDFHRRAYFRAEELGLVGNEEALLISKFRCLISERDALRDKFYTG